jgi:hypothetical protein
VRVEGSPASCSRAEIHRIPLGRVGSRMSTTRGPARRMTGGVRPTPRHRGRCRTFVPGCCLPPHFLSTFFKLAAPYSPAGKIHPSRPADGRASPARRREAVGFTASPGHAYSGAATAEQFFMFFYSSTRAICVLYPTSRHRPTPFLPFFHSLRMHTTPRPPLKQLRPQPNFNAPHIKKKNQL